MEKQILFIEPTAAHINIFSQFTLPRLGTFILAGLVNRRDGWNARVFIEGRARFDLTAWIARHGRPDLVGISTITPTVKRSYALADECRALGIPVILGGPHVTFLPEEALSHADLVVRGEGETAMDALLDQWARSGIQPTDPGYAAIPNLSWKGATGLIQHNPRGAWLGDLDALPVPDFSLAGGTADCVIGGRRTVMVQTSRGCPFDCSFCSVTGMFGKKYRYRSVESVLRELERYDSRNHFVFFCDDNFTANTSRTRALLDALLARHFRFQWSTQVRADLARDPDLVRLMKRAGCHTVFVGFESVSPQSLAQMRKNQSLDDIVRAVRVFQAAGIHIHGMFVLGFDGDDWATVEATIRFARQMRLTSVQVLILTPLPGSELYERLKEQQRITSFDWDLYDTHHVVYRPRGLSPLDLQRAQVCAHTRIYTLSESLRKLLTGQWVAAGLSFYASKINRDWQRQNQHYLETLAAADPSAPDPVGAQSS